MVLNIIGYPHTTAVEPFNILNTGDWLYMIVHKLVEKAESKKDFEIKPTDHPNISRDEVIEMVRNWYEHKKRVEHKAAVDSFLNEPHF